MHVHCRDSTNITIVQDVPDPDKPETWSYQLMPTWLEDGKQHFGGAKGLAELKEMASSLTEPWKSAIENIPDTRSCSQHCFVLDY